MFGMFGKKKPKPSAAPLSLGDSPPPATPTGSAKVSEDEARERFLQLILTGLADQRGVHVETALATLAALAGFSAQIAVRAGMAKGFIPHDQLIKIECVNGEIFYTGDILNPPLLATDPSQTSVFRMTAEAAHAMGARTFPDLTDMVRHMATTWGEPTYGMPRVPDAHLPRQDPRLLLRDSWDTTAAYLRMYAGDATRWPYWIGTVIQKLVGQTTGLIDPNLITPLVMEVALTMSRMDPAVIVGASRHDGPRAIDLTATELGRFLQSQVFNELLDQVAANEAAGKGR
jgi:hypothetical protein